MKATLKIGLVFIFSILMILIIYIIVENNNPKRIAPDNDINDITDKADNDSITYAVDEKEERDIMHASKHSVLVTDTTEYLHVRYDVNEEEDEYYKLPLPAEWIGMDKELLEEKLLEYKQMPTDEDMARGFVDISLISFSSEKIVVRSLYDKNAAHAEDRYYVKNPDGYVSIFYPNTDTLYFETSIVTLMLPEELQKEIENGKYFTTQEQLYHFLESYTS